MSKSNGGLQQSQQSAHGLGYVSAVNEPADQGSLVTAQTETLESAIQLREVKAKLDQYRNAVRALLSKRAPARRISDADLDVFERALARIENPQ